MKMTPLLLGMLMMGGTMLGISSMYGGVQSAYAPGGTANSTIFVKYNQTMMRINGTMTDIETRTTGIMNKGWSDIIGTMTDVSFLFFDVGGVLLEIPNIVLTFISHSFGFLDFLGEAGWFIVVVGCAVIVVVIMALVSIFFKVEV